jgi:lipopolysaccharide/colanic/teichoic acid biosynthesis glycosyltransferase
MTDTLEHGAKGQLRGVRSAAGHKPAVSAVNRQRDVMNDDLRKRRDALKYLRAGDGAIVSLGTRERSRSRSDLYRTVGKRLFDILVASVLLFAMLGVFAAIALAIKLDSPGPIFFRVRRVGYRGRVLMMLKFRKMRDDARGGPLTLDRDPRLTRVGSVLTQTRLDELPQLWDVLRGRMSIIGPRPEDPGFVDLHGNEYATILTVRPGMTGLSQIAYREEATIVDAANPVEDYLNRILPQKLTLDTVYAGALSLRLDVQVIYWTLVTLVARRPVSVNRATAAMRLRRRPAARAPAREARGGSRNASRRGEGVIAVPPSR